MSNKRPPMRVRRGRGALDPNRTPPPEVWEKQPLTLKGFVGGDPAKRPRWKNPIPPEPAPWFRYGQSSEQHRARLLQFLTSAPLEIEIGSGDGRFILAWAQAHPDRHFLAFEVRWKLANRIFNRAQEAGLKNLWVSDNDARLVISEVVPDGAISVVHLLMPDPWWKAKHYARRIISPWFVDVLARKLRPGGILRMETDVEGYPEWAERIVEAHPDFKPHNPELGELFADAPLTSRQEWCREHGFPIYRRFWQRR